MILDIKNLSKEYLRNGEKFFAVKNVNLQITSGEIISIKGESGSGKSTLFHMMGGILKPTEGTIVLDEIDLALESFNSKSSLRNKKISYILQGQNLLNSYNVIDNVCMPYYLSRDKRNIKEEAEGLLKEFGILSLKRSFPMELSGGEKRRVIIARALINNPSLIIADEPTNSLDRDRAEEIAKLLNEISERGTSVIVSTHDSYFDKYAKKQYKMNKGILSL